MRNNQNYRYYNPDNYLVVAFPEGKGASKPVEIKAQTLKDAEQAIIDLKKTRKIKNYKIVDLLRK